MTRYAANTQVPTDRSKAEMERTLVRYGADQFMYGWSAGAAIIGFRMRGRLIRFDLAMPNKAEFRLTATYKERTSQAAIESAWEQACRQRWRALALVVKAKLEAVESGITTFEQEFMANTLLSDGRTVGEFMGPQIAANYESGKRPELLPGLPAAARLQLMEGQ